MRWIHAFSLALFKASMNMIAEGESASTLPVQAEDRTKVRHLKTCRAKHNKGVLSSNKKGYKQR